MKYILFCGGGSAGHVVPNLALMQELLPTHKLAYVGTGGIEKRLVGENYPFFQIDCPKLVRSFTPSNLAIPVRLISAVRKAKELLLREKPDLIFSKGGFASFPAVRAGQMLHIPILTHESDLSAGLCTKLVARRSKVVLTSFPETAERFSNGLFVGSPVRRELFEGNKARAKKKYGLNEKPVLLVLGGGSGSRAINKKIRARLPELLEKFQILHLCGKGNLIEKAPTGYVQLEFERDMGSAYAVSDGVVCRSGSNTLFEVLSLKKKALFIPLQRGSRGDQVENADYFFQKGLCKVTTEEKFEPLSDAVSLLEDEALTKKLIAYTPPIGNEKIIRLIDKYAR